MRRRNGAPIMVMFAAAVFLSSVLGCTPWPFVSSQAVAFGLGWLARDLTGGTTSQTSCYRNGVLIDCSELPANLHSDQP
jgi:hypothetical protein